MRRRIFILVTVAFGLAGCLLAAPAALAAGRVAPGQGFVGRVNGNFSKATVTVFCPGPIRVGSTGHPIAGQTLEVLSPPPPVALGVVVSVGLTGTKGHAIVARFTDDPAVPIAFGSYFVNEAIPTGLRLPCGGTGKVVFRPTPTSKSARSSVVSVTYQNIGV